MADGRQVSRQDILHRVANELRTSPERFTRVIFFLLEEKDATRHFQVLKSVFGIEQVFQGIVTKLAQDTDSLETDANYRRMMADIWTNYLEPYETINTDNDCPRFDFQLIQEKREEYEGTAIFDFLDILSRLSADDQDSIVQVLVEVSKLSVDAMAVKIYKESSWEFLGKTSEMAQFVSEKFVDVSGDVICLPYSILESLRFWWSGEKSGTRSAKDVIDSVAGLAAGIEAGVAGATVGTSIAPGIGTIVGAVLCGVTSAFVVNKISDWMTQKLFNLPKEEALENAYRFLGLSYGASNEHINANYKNLAVKYHPDKGGSYEQWHQLQVSYSLIKISKGEI